MCILRATYQFGFGHCCQIKVNDVLLVSAHYQTIRAHWQHTLHIAHVWRTMRKLWYATSNLMAQSGRCQCQYARVNCQDLPNNFGGMNLEWCVLLHAGTVVRSYMALKHRHRKQIERFSTVNQQQDIRLTPSLPIHSSSSCVSNATALTPNRSPPSARTLPNSTYSVWLVLNVPKLGE